MDRIGVGVHAAGDAAVVERPLIGARAVHCCTKAMRYIGVLNVYTYHIIDNMRTIYARGAI